MYEHDAATASIATAERHRDYRESTRCKITATWTRRATVRVIRLLKVYKLLLLWMSSCFRPALSQPVMAKLIFD